MAFPTRHLWLDLETTALPSGNDYSDVHILEVGAIITDTALNPIVGYTQEVAVTPEAVASLRRNEVVVQMHRTSGLLEDCKTKGKSLEDVESELVNLMVEHSGTGGDFILAGSGVGTFDLQVVREHMPSLAGMLAYFVYDIGVFRRIVRGMTGSVQISHVARSYGDAKEHRAYADVEAHLAEARNYQEWLRGLTGTEWLTPVP